MEKERFAIHSCGATSTFEYEVLVNQHAFPPRSPARCINLSHSVKRQSMLPHRALAVVAGIQLLLIGRLISKKGCLDATAARAPAARGPRTPAEALAIETMNRMTHFQFTPYAESRGHRMIFSREKLFNLAQKLFPSPADALKKIKFLEVGSRIDLSGQTLDLNPVYHTMQQREMKKREGFLRRGAKQPENVLSFPRLVRTAFHNYVNKQQNKAMAELHVENADLARRLDKVDVTSELRSLVASALPAVQPYPLDTRTAKALSYVRAFYHDLAATRQQLLNKFMKEVDLATPLDLNEVLKEGSTSTSFQTQTDEVVKIVEADASHRLKDTLRRLTPSDKLDLAAAGLTSARLEKTIATRVLEKMKTLQTDPSSATPLMRLVQAAEKRLTAKQGGGFQAVSKKALTTLVLAITVMATAAYATYRKRHLARRRPVIEEKEKVSKEDTLDLDVNELVNMPLEQLKNKARLRRKSRSVRKRIKERASLREHDEVEGDLQRATDSDTVAAKEEFVGARSKYA